MAQNKTWRLGPMVGLGLLLAVSVASVLSDPPTMVSKPHSSHNQTNIGPAPEYDHSSFLFTVGAWAKENREIIEPVTALTGLFLAAVVAFVTGGLWAATRALAISTEDLARGAEEQATAMKSAHTLAEKNFELAERQFLLAGRQTCLAEKQHGLQREQYLAEHPPRIKIRSISIVRPPAGALFQDGRIIKGHLVIVNAGASDTQIREAVYRFYWGRGLPMAPPLGEDQVRPLFGAMKLPHPMAGHESCLINIESIDKMGSDNVAIINGNGVFLYVMGAVKFSDWNMDERWMGFCQKYFPGPSGAEGGFDAVPDRNYEYED